jgi:hypothetical protein
MKKIFTLLSFVSVCLISHAQFTAGNLVICRFGDGSAALTSAATPAFLDEYTPAGVLVQSVPLPTTTAGANKRLLVSGTATSEGMIQRSPNGLYLTVAGYDAAAGTASITTSTGATVNRVVARIDYNEVIESSTALTDFADAGNPRSVVTDGTNYWGVGSQGGVRAFTLGATTSTQVSSTVTNIRTVDIYNGQLYISTSSGTAIRVGAVGTGLPTTTGQTITNLPGLPSSTGSPYGFVMLDLNAGVAGPDVLYIADDGATGTVGILKYSLVGGTWTANGNVAVAGNSARGITASVSGGTVNVYVTSSSTFFSLADASGYNGTLTGTATTLASAPANTAFRGIDFAPVSSLPLNLLSFTATLSDNKVNVNWSTANEVNVGGYEIQRSVNGKDFMPISMVQAENAGSTKQYAYTDPRAVAGTSYYRLKMNDKDGSYKYSQIATIKNSIVGISLYPNPVRSNVTIQHESADKGATVSIVGMSGKQLISVNLLPGAVQTTIEAAKLAPGVYMVVYTNNGQKHTKQFIKE